MSKSIENITKGYHLKTPQHGVWTAGYSNTPYGIHPFIDCYCDDGFIDFSWEEVGRQFDEHLREVLSETK